MSLPVLALLIGAGGVSVALALVLLSLRTRRHHLQQMLRTAADNLEASAETLAQAARNLGMVAQAELRELNALPLQRLSPPGGTNADQQALAVVGNTSLSPVSIQRLARFLQHDTLNLRFRLVRLLWPEEEKAALVAQATAAQQDARSHEAPDAGIAREITLLRAQAQQARSVGFTRQADTHVRERVAKARALAASCRARASELDARARALPERRVAVERRLATERATLIAAAVAAGGALAGRKAAAHLIMLLLHAVSMGLTAPIHHHGALAVEHLIIGTNGLIDKIPFFRGARDAALESALTHLDAALGGYLSQLSAARIESELVQVISGFILRDWTTGVVA